MDKIDLGKLGEVAVAKPRSFAAINDLCAEWTDTASRAKLARLCGAAVGICWDYDVQPKGPPRYSVEAAEPVAYGGAVIDWLYSKDISPALVYPAGRELVEWLFGHIPTEAEVTEAEDFSEGESARLTG
jgi:hypothetical protein